MFDGRPKIEEKIYDEKISFVEPIIESGLQLTVQMHILYLMRYKVREAAKNFLKGTAKNFLRGTAKILGG